LQDGDVRRIKITVGSRQ